MRKRFRNFRFMHRAADYDDNPSFHDIFIYVAAELDRG
jgi:hypothetical protein